MMKRFSALVSIFMFILSINTLTLFAEAPGETIKVGVAGPMNGNFAAYGIPVQAAVELAAKQINAKGGVLGKKLEVLGEDDICEPNTAASVAAKLIGERVVGVIGHVCSGATEATLSSYQSGGVVVVSPASTSPSLSLEGKYPNFYRTIAHDAAQSNLQVDFAINELGIKTAVILHDKGTYGKGLAELSRKRLEESGVKVKLYEGVTPGAVDYSAVVRRIRRIKPDAIFFGGYYPEASKLVTQIRQKRIKSAFIAGDGAKDDILIKISQKYSEGVYVTAPQDISQVPLAKQFSEDYKKEYGKDIGTFSLQSVAALNMLVAAIEKAGSTDYAKIKKALHEVEADTTLGRISFDKNGDVVGAGFTIYKVQDKNFVMANNN